jgi:hypothetical protein
MELLWRDLAGFRPHVLELLGLNIGARLSSVQIELLRSENTHGLLAQKIPHVFSEVRVFHACRPVTLSSYYERGLMPLDLGEMSRIARALFLEVDPSLKEEHLQDVVDKLQPDGRDGRLYAALDDRFLIRRCGHYLIYGSEFLYCVANQLSGVTGVDYTSWLKQRGRPTMIVASIPISELSGSKLRELAGAMCHEVAFDASYERAETSLVDFGFSRCIGIPSNHIRDHYHPAVILDPLSEMEPYRWEESKQLKAAT